MSDIAYTWTGSGWTYLAIIVDLSSRRVVGWVNLPKKFDRGASPPNPPARIQKTEHQNTAWNQRDERAHRTPTP